MYELGELEMTSALMAKRRFGPHTGQNTLMMRALVRFVMTVACMAFFVVPGVAQDSLEVAPQETVLEETVPAVSVPLLEEPVEVLAPPVLIEQSALPHDLSPVGMFMAADSVVKAVLIGLALASVSTWTIWLAKSLELTGARFRARRALKVIQTAQTLDEADRNLAHGLGSGRGPVASMVRAASHEALLSNDAIMHAGGDGLKERVVSNLSRIEVAAARRISMGMGMLATISSTAPFIGLFGTVWGIMNAFIGISESQTTNLAVVAPGIAEALLATAAGLIAAIPAGVIYNIFVRSVSGYRQLLGDAAAGVERLVSRDLDCRHIPVHGDVVKTLAAE